MSRDDSITYNNVMLLSENDALRKIYVSEPQKNADNVVFYKVQALDSKGIFTVQRRYSDFEALRQAWNNRLCGLYIPCLPPKKFIGNTDKAHIEERCFLLEQFLKKVHMIHYLQMSEEY